MAISPQRIIRSTSCLVLLQPSQHGFRSGFSCGSNLLSFLETITSLVDAKENVDAIYLDLTKAFDKVPHKRLLLKLEAHGIRLQLDYILASR